MMKDISSLPDYATLKKLASALWQQDRSYHGAAVMVGAGFSRSAASTGDATKKLPLWNDLSKTLAAELGSSSTGPLRLAEEYCAYFGKQALYDRIKKEINDPAWVPGDLYKSLLELPWSEVLTTNWDTLLERASTEVHHPVYSIVSKQEDLSNARSPRIVKLHGTIDITTELIFTQEDYRKYPQRYAAFVNFSRQVFIENELCLLGFSGDDPNFLQWAGWVRDHLAAHSRRIYLVGALRLNAAKRKYLESIHIAPIDLGDLVSDYDESNTWHLESTKIFVQALQEFKPQQAWEWNPAKLHRTITIGAENIKIEQDTSYSAELIEKRLPALEKDRLSYPGWLICPYPQRFRLQSQIINSWPNPNNLSAMSGKYKAKLLYEITWHHQVTFQAMPSWLVNELFAVCDPDKPCALSTKQQLEIALALLKNTRWMDKPEAEHIAQATGTILEKGKRYWSESSDEFNYHSAIMARNAFDYAALEQYTKKITNSNPIWKLRKASLLAELGQFREGGALVAKAYKDLLIQHRNDRHSIHVLSRLAWAHWLMRRIDWPSFSKKINAFSFRIPDSKCDPWNHIEYIRERISKEMDTQKKQQTIEPSFEPGYYTDHSHTSSINNELHPFLLLESISSIVGIPLRWSGSSLLVEQAARLAELDDLDNTHRFALAIRSADNENSPVLNKVFSRIQIARFSESEANFLLNKCMIAINYWTKKRAEKSENSDLFFINRLRIFIEILARVSVRITPEQAKQIFRLAVSLGKNLEFHHLLLFDALGNLLTNSINSIPKSHQHEVLLDALSFPLQQEIHSKNHQKRWPNPVIEFPGSRNDNTALDRRVDEIIDSIDPCSVLSSSPLLRLLPLVKKGFLNQAECQKIGEKIWGSVPDYQSLPKVGIFPHAFLALPAPDSLAVRSIVKKYLFEKNNDQIFDYDFLTALANSARIKNYDELPTPEQAEAYFEELTSWRARENGTDPLGFANIESRKLQLAIGEALAYTIVPALRPDTLKQDNFHRLLAFHLEVDAPSTIIALSRFAANNGAFAEQIEKIIRQDLQGRAPHKVAPSAFALLQWREIQNSSTTNRLVSRLIYLLGANLGDGLPTLLSTAGQLYAKNYLSDNDIESLIESIPWVFDSADYKNIAPSSREAISVSLVRAECVRLAQIILSRSQSEDSELCRIVHEAKHDPLPEVRFSLNADK